ncbi:MAG: hypothetical protein IKL59_08300 [Clostridia bacterium]|nr:hypothetical protein [Clostridia bacterium]
MSNEMNIQEIITELDKIDTLCGKIVDINEKCDSLVSVQNKREMDEATQKTVKILEDYEESQKKKLSDVASKLPIKFPQEPPKSPMDRNLDISKSSIMLSAVSLFLVYFSIIGLFIASLIDILFVPYCILVGLTVFMNYKFPVSNANRYVKCYKSLITYEKLAKEWENEFEKQYTTDINEKRYIAFKAYDDKFLSFVEDCDKKFEEENIRHKEEIEKIGEKNRKKLDGLHQEKNALIDELTSTSLIPEDLYFDAWRISSMLKQRRADSLKEAINLALDEKRKDEEEEARREEAARREVILEQQAYDNRMHNEAMQRAAEEEARATREHNAAMERAAREHNAAMERAAQAQATAAEAQAREAQKQTRMATQQASDAERGARERCNRCANAGKCSVKFGKGAIGCPSYRPR